MEEKVMQWLKALEAHIERGWRLGENGRLDDQIRVWRRAWATLARLCREVPEVTFSAIEGAMGVELDTWLWTFLAMLENWMFRGEKELRTARKVLGTFLRLLDDDVGPDLAAMARGILGLNLQWSEGFFAADAYYRHAIKTAPGHGSTWLRWSLLYSGGTEGTCCTLQGDKKAREILHQGLAQLRDPLERQLLLEALKR